MFLFHDNCRLEILFAIDVGCLCQSYNFSSDIHFCPATNDLYQYVDPNSSYFIFVQILSSVPVIGNVCPLNWGFPFDGLSNIVELKHTDMVYKIEIYFLYLKY